MRRIAAVAALAAGLLYLALTGGHIPILRSFAMACVVTLGVLSGRRAISVRALALAAVALMLFAPAEVMGVSFQMSFAAVLALVAGWEVLAPRLALLGAGAWWRGPALYVGGLALTSALAGTASLPFAAYHFGNAALFYVPANVIAVPLTGLWVMPWGAGGAGADAGRAGTPGAGADGVGRRGAAFDRAYGRGVAGRYRAGAADTAGRAAAGGAGAGGAVHLAYAGGGWLGWCRWRWGWPRRGWWWRPISWWRRMPG